jgi:NAD(P)-dependent dehydrogenase (short-subunit alcohol dehydrogenase family)
MRLKGKKALITGASRGIGAAIAKAYAKEGAHVILVARKKKGLEKIDDEIKALGGTATLVPINLENLDQIDHLALSIAERFGGLDILVGNAGLLGQLSPITSIPSKVWDQVINVNLNANMRLIRNFDPLLRKAEHGRAIFVSSGVSKRIMPYFGLYRASKVALDSLIETYAEEVASTNIRVNYVYPGAVRTDMRAEGFPGEDPMTVTAPEDITEAFIELAEDSCERHGECVDLNK